MIKTAILVLSLSGNVVYEAEMPTMKECLAARTEIVKQKSSFEPVCVPTATRPRFVLLSGNRSTRKNGIKSGLGTFINLFNDSLARKKNCICKNCSGCSQIGVGQ